MIKDSISQPEDRSTLPQESQAANQKREQILQGAMQIFLQSGYAGTSMDRVAAEAGVAKQTIYSHFQDKEGLFKALMEQVTLDRFRSVFSLEDFDGDPAIRLRQLAETYLTKVADQNYLSVIRIIIGESERFPELARLWTSTVIQRGRGLLSGYFDAHPELGIADSEAMAHIFFGSLVSFVLMQEMLYGKEMMPLERDRLITTLLTLILKNA
ncbi:MAG: TetR/AcrR family transcriptional regulator [Tildeniella nuda ZEHNDER 1965/U140]|jgi:AcrR family transcriptional regulator|nr:TetR/AcrR family transcriptional regulator [Tildeniella nuda ZEHNDER 1965/U140]